ncbi:hypothetical protein K466DRAFT_345947 [Polyporus arcularius HHB13444]|uniref:Uncharacterized protein n=1 Tax=Polyporus arcularius HHB13444 TaxID=1314778 RepID=A0A5C3PP43_9APHY|nr:hypothetical protein K466DRAFT_345947 [Polyporus arcularius HHB13444]
MDAGRGLQFGVGIGVCSLSVSRARQGDDRWVHACTYTARAQDNACDCEPGGIHDGLIWNNAPGASPSSAGSNFAGSRVRDGRRSDRALRHLRARARGSFALEASC